MFRGLNHLREERRQPKGQGRSEKDRERLTDRQTKTDTDRLAD